MRYRYLLALSVALSIAGFVSQALAQDSAGRDAAIGRCIRQAHLQYPNEADNIPRSEVYKDGRIAG